MKTFGFVVFGVLLSFVATAQVTGKMFPDMEAETVEDKKVKLPQEVKGKLHAPWTSLFKKIRGRT
jgi:hypothetical protein